MARPQIPDEFELKIDRLAQGGRGVGRYEGVVVFVPQAAPGDRLLVRVIRRKRRHVEAELLRVLEPGPGRCDPPCPVFGRCGGCAWQHLDYEAQTAAKQALVHEAFLAEKALNEEGMPPIEVLTPIGAPSPFHYRNKMEFAFAGDGSLGLHPRGQFDQVIPIERCALCAPWVDEALSVVRAWVARTGTPGYDRRSHQGFLRHLVVREGRQTGERLIALVTEAGTLTDVEALTAALQEAIPGLVCLLHIENEGRSDTVEATKTHLLYGRDHLFESLGGLSYAVGLPTFFQTNTDAAQLLVAEVLRLAALKGDETVLDVFCGVGAFSLLLAPQAAKVYGVEIVPEAIEAAKLNAKRAGLGNLAFFAGDARRTLPKVLAASGRPDLILLDPPRSGAGGKVMRRLGRTGAERIFYVSCNPTTLAPDLAWLMPLGYRLETLQPVDLFPQTWHVETIAALRFHPERVVQEERPFT